MEHLKNCRPIPSDFSNKNLGTVLKSAVQALKNEISKVELQKKLASVGIKSRVSFRSIVAGRRQFPLSKFSILARALDWSYNDLEFLKGNRNIWRPSIAKADYITYPTTAIATPLHTIILNTCDLKDKYSIDHLVSALQRLFAPLEIRNAIMTLLDLKLLQLNDSGKLERTKIEYRFSTPTGIKLDYVKSYIEQTMDLAKISYALPLDEREYTAFTCRIDREDFPKVKDLIRDFRKAMYSISKSENCDTVLQVNTQAFFVTSKDDSKQIQPTV